MISEKPFDCVEMKHKAAEIVQAKLATMSRDEKVRYFQERTKTLRELQQKLIIEHSIISSNYQLP